MDVGLVCDDCRTFNAMGASACTRCGEALELDLELEPIAAGLTVEFEPIGREPLFKDTPAEAPRAEPETRACGTCGNLVPTQNRFCGGCGSPMPEETRLRQFGRAPEPVSTLPAPIRGGAAVPGSGKKTLFFGAMQASRAKLVVIKGDGLDGISFTLAGADHQAGRVDVPILFEEDAYLSPVHANFFYQSGKLVVRDESSLNGIYIRIRGAVRVGFGDRFLVGEQIIEVEELLPDPGKPADPDGTYFYASPRPPTRFRLLQRLRGGDIGAAVQTPSDLISLGREGNDMNFPDDPFISGHHAQVSFDRDTLTLTDLGSKNGTFLRITADTVLEHGDYVFMGQQLLRVEIV